MKQQILQQALDELRTEFLTYRFEMTGRKGSQALKRFMHAAGLILDNDKYMIFDPEGGAVIERNHGSDKEK